MQNAKMLYRAISHPVRISILSFIASEVKCVQDIEKHIGMNQSETSQHLAILRKAVAVIATRNGQRVLYRANEAIIDYAKAADSMIFQIQQLHK